MNSVRVITAAVLGGAVAAGLAGVPAVATDVQDTAARKYVRIEVSNPAGGYTAGRAVNDRREVVGGTDGMSGVSGVRPFVWRSGTLSQLAVLTMRSTGEALDISNTGQIVGVSSKPNADGALIKHAVYWKPDGSVWELPGLGGADVSTAVAVNDAGTIVGWAEAPGSHERHAVRWDNGAIRDLGAGEAVDVNNRGQIAGSKVIANETHAVRWETDGTVTDLGSLYVPGHSFAQGLNNRGEVVGSSNGAMGTAARAFQAGSTIKALPATGQDAWANAINDRGEVIGRVDQHPVVWFNGREVDLRTRGVDGSVLDINNRGDLLGRDTSNAYLYI